MIPSWVYAVAGTLAVLVLGRRLFRRFFIRRRLYGALRSPREIQRRVGVRECVAFGVTETARMLARHIRREQSSAVLDELLVALAERQWEPTSNASLMELRIWAKQYGLEHPEALALVQPVVPPELLAGRHEPAAAETEEGVPAAEPEHAAQPVRLAARSGGVGQVAPTTVLVSGASGPAALATIAELGKLGHRVVAVDRDHQSAGLQLADIGEVIPAPGEPSFAVCLVQVARAHGAAAMISTAADEQDALHAVMDELVAAGVRCALPRLDAVRACNDPQRLRTVLNDDGLATSSAGAVQPAPGRDFSADVLISEEGHTSGIVPHWQTETIAGMSARAETFADERVSDTCVRAVKSLRLTGPASVVGSVTATDEIVLLEVRPYFSADLALSLHAGADLVGQHLRVIFGLPILVEQLAARPGVIMTREIHETFEE